MANAFGMTDAIIIMLAASVTLASITSFFFWPKNRAGTPGDKKRNRPVPAEPDMIFAEGALVSLSEQAENFLQGSKLEWDAVFLRLHDQFPALLPDPTELCPDGNSVLLPSEIEGDRLCLICQNVGGQAHIRLAHGPADPSSLGLSPPAIDTIASLAPYPIWQSNSEGEVLWANSEYRALRDRISAATTQKAAIFDVAPEEEPTRCRLLGTDGEPLWYSVVSRLSGKTHINFAVDINQVVRAELAQRNFVQTLTKTFAQLSIGLAIFDRKRQLVLFNPALIDLTALPADFLSGRPHLLSFFDRLRDNRVMPEPKNYANWREKIVDLVAAASDGNYNETWTLETGLTYKISGRPHPDGAIAFLIEDISAEVTLTRQFRSQLDLGQSMIDAMPDAIVVFSGQGTLFCCNDAYCQMWAVDPGNAFAETTVIDAMRSWLAKAEPSPVWGELRDFVLGYQERVEWHAEVTLLDGTTVDARFVPLRGGATLINFSPMTFPATTVVRHVMT